MSQQKSVPYAERVELSIKTNFFGTLDMCHSFFPLLRPHARYDRYSYGVPPNMIVNDIYH